MIKTTPVTKQYIKGTAGVNQFDQDLIPPKRKLQFPVLKLEKVKKQRKQNRKLLQTLFPKPVRLYRLIHDVEKNFAKEFASIIGSVDFAEQRLAGLLMSLKELVEKIEERGELSLDEVRDYIQLDQRIHESFEELIYESAKFSFEEVSQ